MENAENAAAGWWLSCPVLASGFACDMDKKFPGASEESEEEERKKKEASVSQSVSFFFPFPLPSVLSDMKAVEE